jgi:hypothetical protein
MGCEQCSSQRSSSTLTFATKEITPVKAAAVASTFS